MDYCSDCGTNDQMFDSEECNSTVFQRPIHYLRAMESQRIPAPFDPQHSAARGSECDCLEILIRYLFHIHMFVILIFQNNLIQLTHCSKVWSTR